ncbi:dihydrouridine synthase 3 [Oratosquilla oratoria]|uniref:dihydrouridine synthase 3 n=1 Tax=Oratosquilla oratoria TaxID=337810 RepID=UPI003F7704E7
MSKTADQICGMAFIKPQYIIPFEPSKESTKNETVSKGDGGEPPTKKQKSTGQNKNRPKMNKTPRSSKLCPSLCRIRVGEEVEGRCTFPNCGFSHEIADYLAKKPSNLGEVCHNFRTFGQCHYGLTCRYGSDHIKGSANVINAELWEKTEKRKPVRNVIDREVQMDLRKRVYGFSRAAAALKVAQSSIARSKASSAPKNKIESEEDRKKEDKNSSQNGDGFAENHCEGKNTDLANSKADENQDTFTEDEQINFRLDEKKKIHWKDKLYLAPLTTVGNLPFRRICKKLGADITCGEMAMASCLLQGTNSEWALVKRHHTEDLFGVQVCGSNVEVMIKCAQVLDEKAEVDFIDINMGCPIDLVYKQGAGSALMRRQSALEHMVKGMTQVLSVPLTLKMRAAIYHDTRIAHSLIGQAKHWGVSLFTVHGRSREQRYTKQADWKYVEECAQAADPVPLFGNGDIMSFEDYNIHKENSQISGVMIGRGALIKPWIFTEIKEQRHWDISSSERFDIIKEYVNNGLEHWGSDTEGVEKTRRFLLEWLSFLHRYIPVGLLETLPQQINQRPPPYVGRNDMETLMASRNVKDWVKISEMLLGPVPDDFMFLPKHKANSWS